MNYQEFAQKFLVAVYWETQTTGKEYHRAESLFSKYSFDVPLRWISRVADAWEHVYFRDVTQVLAGYEGWSFRISAQGEEKVEDEFESEEAIKSLLGISEIIDLQSLSTKLAPAAGRFVELSHNQATAQIVIDGIADIAGKIEASNELNPSEKADVLISLGAARQIFERSKTALIGAFQYLVLERLKKAFEKTIEDVFRLAIIATLGIIVAALLVIT